MHRCVSSMGLVKTHNGNVFKFYIIAYSTMKIYFVVRLNKTQ